ncbi:hypothetical protein [Hyphomicrobium sp. 99]|uniref:hypothetical protein n=1 Tax=Hyphomicrobium sp. 99 TaxID=1163419 RepID=UPI0005F838FA|nr:hypothetical protein [Hyphomicrobium sp. 99]
MLYEVSLCRLFVVLPRVDVMRLCQMGVVSSLFVLTRLIVLGSFLVVLRGMLVMLGGFLMMFVSFLSHFGQSFF